MEALARTGVTAARIILQAKQYRRPVSRRFVDELRGTLLRLDARQGLLISTSTFSSVARLAAETAGSTDPPCGWRRAGAPAGFAPRRRPNSRRAPAQTAFPRPRLLRRAGKAVSLTLRLLSSGLSLCHFTF